MSDLALIWNPTLLVADLAIENNDIARDDGLMTAVLLSLFLDRQAEAGDVLPSGVTDRRGWWGDSVPVVEGDKIGSRLWLLDRETQTATTLRRAEAYAREALQWLLDDRVAERVEVAASFPRPGMIAWAIDVYRPQVDPASYRFAHAWAAMGA